MLSSLVIIDLWAAIRLTETKEDKMNDRTEIYAPRIKDPDTMRSCVVHGVGFNRFGKKFVVVLEDASDDGSRKREAQKKAYTVSVDSLWYN